jgi:hypothetical protein
MSSQVMVIGLGEEERGRYAEIAEENALFRDNVGVVQFRTALQAQAFVRKLEPLAGVRACLMSTYCSVMDFSKEEYTPLPRLTTADFHWSNGYENIAVVSNELFSLCEVRNRELIEINSFGTRAGCVLSTTGLFICLYEDNRITLRVGDSKSVFSRMTLRDTVSNAKFSLDDKFMAVFMKDSTEIWDVFKGMYMAEEAGSSPADVAFDDENVYFLKAGRTIPLRSDARATDCDARIVKAEGRQRIRFYDGRVQRIEYSVDGYVRSKTQANIDKIDFLFAESKCYAVMRKEIQKEKTYFIESYGREGITMTSFKVGIASAVVSDTFFVVADLSGAVSFFKKDKFKYSLVKQVRKEEDVILSLSGDVCCLHDSGTGNVEFYDNGEPRSVYTHQLCNRIEWSCSGLFVATMSVGSSSSGLVQLFNKNGKLLWKKVFSKLLCFLWRPFVPLTGAEKEEAFRMHDLSTIEIENEDEENGEELLSRWKSYLLSKRQLLEAK